MHKGMGKIVMEIDYKDDAEITINKIFVTETSTPFRYFGDNFCEKSVETITVLHKDIEIWNFDCTVPTKFECMYTFSVFVTIHS